MEVNRIYNEDCLSGLKKLPDSFIDCCVTSPPYYGLRDYGNNNQIGLEETPEAYVSKLVEVFREVKRVLKKTGVLWLNLGDSYAGSGRGANENGKQGTNKGTIFNPDNSGKTYGLKPKDLIGTPWMVAFALRADGWYLRQDIIWAKPNPMPESVTDRCTKSHEYIFLLSKSQKYYYDAEAIKQDFADSRNGNPGKYNWTYGKVGLQQKGGLHNGDGIVNGWNENGFETGANKRSVWTVTTKPFTEAHFATFPEDLISDCIKAGCPEFVCNKCGKAREKIVERERKMRNELDKNDSRYRPNQYNGSYADINGKGDAGYTFTKVIGLTNCNCSAGFSPGIVLDPFMGAGTTAVVARKLNRNYLGFELNANYLKIAERRLYNEIGMFL